MPRIITIAALIALLTLVSCNKYRFHTRETPVPPQPSQLNSLLAGHDAATAWAQSVIQRSHGAAPGSVR